MDPNALPLPQPDIDVLVGAINTVTHEISLMPNMPVVQTQQAILAALNRLENRLDRLENRLDSKKYT
jgi:hypothetical protein